MGTINYKTSKYITMGATLFEADPDADYDEYLFAHEDYDLACEEAAQEVRARITAYGFDFFDVTVDYGYYEGFCILIDSKYVYYDDAQEKREAQAEITRLKKFLRECADMGLRSCYPGWCMGYADYAGTLKDIDEAIREMRQEVKATPTWEQYERKELQRWVVRKTGR